jgi:hypothetical protein
LLTAKVKGGKMIGYVLVLILTVSNCDTGDTLFESETPAAHPFYQSELPVMDCIKDGVEKAKILAAEWRKSYSNSSVNVTCKWRKGNAI